MAYFRFRCSIAACQGPSRRKSGPCHKCEPGSKRGSNFKGTRRTTSDRFKPPSRLDHNVGKGGMNNCQYLEPIISRSLTSVTLLSFPIKSESPFVWFALMGVLVGGESVLSFLVFVQSSLLRLSNFVVPLQPCSAGVMIFGSPGV